jgi:chloramphenicol-sensitive protein RarD
MRISKHYSAAILAFVIWGFFPIPLRWLQSYPAGEIAFFRILLSLITLGLIIGIARRKALQDDVRRLQQLDRRQRRKAIWLTVAGAFLLGINWLLFIYIVNSVNVKTASFTYLICPVITAVLGSFILKERLTTLQWLAVALCAASCVLVGLNSAPELAYSLLTALSYALYLISQRTLQGFDRLTVLGLQVLIAFVGFLALYPYLVDGMPTEPWFYVVVMFIAVVFTVIPLFLNLYALNAINAATIGILMYINPLLNFILAIALYKETVTVLQACGYGIILVGLLLFNYNNFQKVRSLARTS